MTLGLQDPYLSLINGKRNIECIMQYWSFWEHKYKISGHDLSMETSSKDWRDLGYQGWMLIRSWKDSRKILFKRSGYIVDAGNIWIYSRRGEYLDI